MRIAVHPDNVICSVSREKISSLRKLGKDFLEKIKIMSIMPFYEHQIKRCGSAKTFLSYPEIFDARKRTSRFQRKKIAIFSPTTAIASQSPMKTAVKVMSIGLLT